MDEVSSEWSTTETDPDLEGLTPLELFELFVDDDVISHICEQTNLYAVQKNVNSTTTNVHEIRKFLGINVLASIVKVPQYRMYWAQATRYAPIADSMSRNRFEFIKTNLHLNDNSNIKERTHIDYDRLFKVRPFVEKIRKNFNKIASEEHNAVDEVLIPCKSRQSLVQYIKSKPHKWGIKLFARCNSKGLMNDFEIYAGKDTCTAKSDLGISGDIVLRLCEKLPSTGNFKVYTDNWFSSFKLACALKDRGIFTLGSIRSNRLPHCKFQDDKILKSKGRGSFDFRCETNNNILAVKWYDNKAVHIISSFVGIEPVNTVQRWSVQEKKYVEVPRPYLVDRYNKYMGGVDLNDMLVALYRMDIGVKRYYLRIFYGLIDISIVNAWLLYRKCCQNKGKNFKIMPLLAFKADIGHALISARQPAFRAKRGRPSTSRQISDSSPSTSRLSTPTRTIQTPRVVPDVRFDGLHHMPECGKKMRCKNCKHTAFTRVRCQKCNVWLCLTTKKNCFSEFHTQK